MLGTAADQLAGIYDPVRVERALDASHQPGLERRQIAVDQIDLGLADAAFGGNGAAMENRGAVDSLGEFEVLRRRIRRCREAAGD